MNTESDNETPLTADEARTAVAAYLAEQGIAYTAVFVPQSASRNSANKDPSLNWRVSFIGQGQGAVLATDYTQGIGHVVGLKISRHKTLNDEQQWLTASERGMNPVSMKRLPKPTSASVLHSILLDSDVLNHDGFESWASEFGYDTDSRKAEGIYNECRKIAGDLVRVFSKAQREHLAELLQDY